MSKHYTKKQRKRDERIILFIYGLIIVAFLSVIFSAWWAVFRTTRLLCALPCRCTGLFRMLNEMR